MKDQDQEWNIKIKNERLRSRIKDQDQEWKIKIQNED